MEVTNLSKKELEKQEIEAVCQSLEDISNLTYDYVSNKISSHIDIHTYEYINDNHFVLVPILDDINSAVGDKKYIVPYKSYFLTKKGSSIIKSKNIDPFSFAVSSHCLEYTTRCIREFIQNGSNSNSTDRELSIFRNRIERYKKEIHSSFSNPKSKLYSVFKTHLSLN